MSNENLIKKAARRYIKYPNATIRSIAEEFGMGASTLQGYFAKDLKEISPKLYDKVNKKKASNIERAKHVFEKPTKKCIIDKIKELFHRV